jgi:endonuclease-3
MKRKWPKEADFQAIIAALRTAFGEPEMLHQASPLSRCDSALEVLLATILTQATNDRNAMRAWLQFKARFPEPHGALAVSTEELAAVIRSAGLNTQKAAVFQKVLQAISQDDSDHIFSTAQAKPEQLWQSLNTLPGVGPKTAACTMLFGLGLPAFPVDLHINRIAQRMGWVPLKSPPERTQAELTRLIPLILFKNMHILLLELGRRFCRPRQPRCGECPLRCSCPYPAALKG